MIRVIYRDKSTGVVAGHRLDELIATGRIAAFYRADGWVSVERGPIRGKGDNAGGYDGPERRTKAERPMNSDNYFG